MLNIGFIGGGNMMEAMFTAALNAKITAPDHVIASARSASTRKKLESKFSIKTTEDNNEVCQNSDVVIIAVKPQVVDGVLQKLKLNIQPLYISVVGGYRLANLEHYLKGARVVRVMPNTPCAVGYGASGYVLGSLCGERENELTKRLMESCGVAHKVDTEELLDTVCGLAGSGPAYVYMMIEALSDAGVHGGLSRVVATDLAANVVLGGAEMVRQHGHPAVLRNKVESPGGTTITGTTTLEQYGFRNAVIQAVLAATKKSFEMGQRSDREI